MIESLALKLNMISRNGDKGKLERTSWSRILTSCTTRYFESFFQSREGDNDVNKGHCLHGSEEAIHRYEIFRGGTIS